MLARNKATPSPKVCFVPRLRTIRRLNTTVASAHKAFEPLARITLAILYPLSVGHILIWHVISPLIASRYVRRRRLLSDYYTFVSNASWAKRQAIYWILYVIFVEQLVTSFSLCVPVVQPRMHAVKLRDIFVTLNFVVMNSL